MLTSITLSNPLEAVAAPFPPSLAICEVVSQKNMRHIFLGTWLHAQRGCGTVLSSGTVLGNGPLALLTTGLRKKWWRCVSVKWPFVLLFLKISSTLSACLRRSIYSQLLSSCSSFNWAHVAAQPRAASHLILWKTKVVVAPLYLDLSRWSSLPLTFRRAYSSKCGPSFENRQNLGLFFQRMTRCDMCLSHCRNRYIDNNCSTPAQSIPIAFTHRENEHSKSGTRSANWCPHALTNCMTILRHHLLEKWIVHGCSPLPMRHFCVSHQCVFHDAISSIVFVMRPWLYHLSFTPRVSLTCPTE